MDKGLGTGEAREISISGYNVDFIQSICASKRVMYCKAVIFRVHLIFANFASSIKSQN